MRASKPKDLYVSPYNTELVDFDGIKMTIQFLPDENREDIIKNRRSIASKRINEIDMRITPYFETRCKNLVAKLYACKDGNELVSLLIKNTGVSMSGHFLYRDVIDIVNKKASMLEFDAEHLEILNFIIQSLKINNVIAPKIKAIYSIRFKVDNED